MKKMKDPNSETEYFEFATAHCQSEIRDRFAAEMKVLLGSIPENENEWYLVDGFINHLREVEALDY
jgi:hypothetical protein